MCQCPQRASIHFYFDQLYKISKTESVSMPSTGFYPFLPCILPEMESRFSVSMPSTGFYPFLQDPDEAFIKAVDFVSMPSTGFYPFLLSPFYDFFTTAMMCQCPQRASIHFYEKLMKRSKTNTYCVNALNGLLSISTERKQMNKSEAKATCQCPQRASIHFYIDVIPEELISEMCQCPQRASIHFYCQQ